jgi:hypothetical protein
VVNGKLTKPEDLPEGSNAEQVKNYKSKLEFFTNAKTMSLLVLTANIVMGFDGGKILLLLSLVLLIKCI